MLAAVPNPATGTEHQPSLSPPDQAQAAAQQCPSPIPEDLPEAVATTPQAASEAAPNAARNAVIFGSLLAASQAAAAAPLKHTSQLQSAGANRVQPSVPQGVSGKETYTPAHNGAATETRMPHDGSAADALMPFYGDAAAAAAGAAAAEPDDGMTENWFQSVAGTATPYSFTLKQHRKLRMDLAEHVARMILKRNRTEESDARLRLMISRVLSHDMVPEVLARLKIPQLVQFLYEHPNKHVSNEAKKLNKSEDWKTALQLMRKRAMQELGITKAQADRIVAHMERTHTFPEMAGSAINADVIMGDELAADVAEEGGNAGRHGKRGRRSNKELLPAPAEKRKAAALGAGAQPKTVPVPGRKRLRKKLAREDDSPPAIGDQQAAEHALQERAASEEPRRDVALIRHAEHISCVAPRSDLDNHPTAPPAAADTEAQNAPPTKRGRGRPRKAENQRKQEPPPKVPTTGAAKCRKRLLQSEGGREEAPSAAQNKAAPSVPQQEGLVTSSAQPVVASAANGGRAPAKRARRLPDAQLQSIAPMHMPGMASRQAAAAMAAALRGPAPAPLDPQHRQSPAPELPSPGLSGSSLPAPPASAAAATSAAVAAPDASARQAPPQPRRNGASSKDAGGPAAAAPPPARTGPIAGAERRSRPGRLTMRDVQSLHDSADAACYTSRSPSPPATPLSPMLLPVPPPNSAGAHSPSAVDRLGSALPSAIPPPDIGRWIYGAACSRAASPAPGVPIADSRGSPFRSCPAAAVPAVPKSAPGHRLRRESSSVSATHAILAVPLTALMPMAVAGGERQDESMGVFVPDCPQTERQGGLPRQQGISSQLPQLPRGGSLTEQGMQRSWWQADGSVQIKPGGSRVAAEAQDMQSDSEESARATTAAAAAAADPRATEEPEADPEVLPDLNAGSEPLEAPEPASPQEHPGNGFRSCWRERAASESRVLDGSPIAPPQPELQRSQSLPNGVTQAALVKAPWLLASVVENPENGHAASDGPGVDPPLVNVNGVPLEQPPVMGAAAAGNQNAPTACPPAPDQAHLPTASPAVASAADAARPSPFRASAATEPGSNKASSNAQDVQGGRKLAWPPFRRDANPHAAEELTNGWLKNGKEQVQRPAAAPLQPSTNLRPVLNGKYLQSTPIALDGRPLPRPITLEAPATNAYLGVPGAHEIPAPIHPPRGRGYGAARGFHGGRNHGRGQSFARHSAPRPQRRGFFRPKQWPAGPPAAGTPYWQGSAVHPPVWYPPAPPPLQVVARPMALVAQPTTGAGNRTS